MRPVCYLDLDGVLVDFVGGMFRAHGSALTHADVKSWSFWVDMGVSEQAFWDACTREFWSGLEWTPDGREILNLVEGVSGPENVALMTSPTRNDGAVQGKVDWVSREMPEYRGRLFVGSAKHLAAAPTKLLLDDNDGNYADFLKAGGNALLVPRPWNAQRGLVRGDSFDMNYLRWMVKFVHAGIGNLIQGR